MDRITLDLTNATSDAIGAEHGVSSEELADLRDAAVQAQAAVEARRTEDLRWMDLPYAHEVHDEVLDYAGSVAGRFKNVVVMCGAGSAGVGVSTVIKDAMCAAGLSEEEVREGKTELAGVMDILYKKD